MKYIFAIIAAIMLASCGTKQEQKKSAAAPDENIITLTEAQKSNAQLDFGKVEVHEFAPVIKVNGKIDVPPQNLVSVSVALGGYLHSTKLLPGMHVTKGEVIAVMEDQQYIQLQQDYLTSKAKLQYAQADLKRQQELNTEKATSDKVFQLAEAEYNTQNIMVRSLAEKLKLIGIVPENLTVNNISKNINVLAPITGFVSKVDVNIGKYVNPSDVLFELINPSDIHLNLKVFEKDIPKLFVGQKLVAYTNNDRSKKYPCEIILVSMDVASDRSVEVHCHFESYDKTLLPGMYMNAEIKAKSTKVNTLPERAIVNFKGADYLFVKTAANTYKMEPVSIGDKQGGLVEILTPEISNLKEIVIGGAYTLLMALKNKEE